VQVSRFLIALLLWASVAMADEWKVFSRPSPVYSAIPYESGYVFATGGGIQFSTPKTKKLFTSADGLGATSFYGVAQTESKIYGVSEYGLIAAYDKKSARWKTVNRSYLNSVVRTVPGQVVAEGNTIVIAFENKLAFYDTEQDAFLLSVDRIGQISLVAKPPQKISIKGDSLYVLLGNETYVRKTDWKNLVSDVRLADPLSWEKISGKRDLDKLFPSASADYSKIKRDTVFNNFTLDDVYELAPMYLGGVVAATPDGWMAYGDGYKWRKSVPIWNGMGSHSSAYDYRMKVFSSLDVDLLLTHVWGMGFFLYGDNGYVLYGEMTPRSENSCLDEVEEDYTVAIGTTRAPDSSGFLVATSARQSYGLVYFSKDWEVSCLSGVGSSQTAGVIAAKIDEKTGDWIVYVASKASALANTAGSLDEFRISPPSKNGGRLLMKEKKNYPTPENRAPLDFAMDKDDGSLWMITIGNLAYMDEDRDTIVQPSSTKGLMGAEYSSMDRDVQGNIWLGTTDKGAFRLAKKGKSKDTLTAIHYTTNDGLLSNRINDMAIDSYWGMAWFAHEGGVTRYTRNDLKNADQFMTKNAPADVKAYPNPFRPKQGYHLFIDNISEDSFVSIYNRGGALVKSFYDKDVLGGRAEWDGTDANGKLVAPGVYHYVVRKGFKAKTGKIILIH
jgi:hypothetical protein